MYCKVSKKVVCTYLLCRFFWIVQLKIFNVSSSLKIKAAIAHWPIVSGHVLDQLYTHTLERQQNGRRSKMGRLG